MSKEQAVKFLNEYKISQALMEKVESIFEDNPGLSDMELWILAAKENGYDFTLEELDRVFHERMKVVTKVTGARLNEAELSSVAGGESLPECETDGSE